MIKPMLIASSLLLLLLTACQGGGSQTKTESATEMPAVTPVDPSGAVAETTSVPKMGNIPVFDNFADLEPIFHKQTDTTYVINFWATWCKPCVEELPYFEQLHEAVRGEKVKITLVSLDFPKQLESKLLPFVKEHQLKPEVVALTDVRQNEWIDKVDPQWSGAIPITIIYKGDRRQFIEDQFASYEELESMVREIEGSQTTSM